jgi:hypothetical protein
MKMIDYAEPTMKAEKALKELHQAMLARRFDDAREAALRCMVECRIAYHSIRVMEEEYVKTAARS